MRPPLGRLLGMLTAAREPRDHGPVTAWVDHNTLVVTRGRSKRHIVLVRKARGIYHLDVGDDLPAGIVSEDEAHRAAIAAGATEQDWNDAFPQTEMPFTADLEQSELDLGPWPARLVRAVQALGYDDPRAAGIRAVRSPADEDAFGNAAIARGGELVGYHVTDDPDGLVAFLESGGDVLGGRARDKFGDLGPGFYVSAIPQIWVGRSTGKWDFLKTLDEHQRRALADAIRRDRHLTDPGYVTASERERALQDLERFEAQGDWYIVYLAGQPYNIAFWKKDFLEPLGIAVGRGPAAVEVRFVGRYVELDGGLSDYGLPDALRAAGYQGAFTRDGMGSIGQLVIWDSAAIRSVRKAEMNLGAQRTGMDDERHMKQRRPALRLNDGSLVVGELGQMHVLLLMERGLQWDEVLDTGFVDDDGQYQRGTAGPSGAGAWAPSTGIAKVRELAQQVRSEVPHTGTGSCRNCAHVLDQALREEGWESRYVEGGFLDPDRFHAWVEIDGWKPEPVVVDVTASQFQALVDEPIPDVYIGPRRDWYVAMSVTASTQGKFRFAWSCPAPPEWVAPTGTPWEGQFVVRYVQDHEEEIPYEEFEAAIGEDAILDEVDPDRQVYDSAAPIADDWSVSWARSQYPDGTPIYVMTHSGIEHVFEPINYQPPPTFSAPDYTDEPEPHTAAAVPPPLAEDLRDALEYAFGEIPELSERFFDADFDSEYPIQATDLQLDRLARVDPRTLPADLSSWCPWKFGELRGLPPEDLDAELKSFRGYVEVSDDVGSWPEMAKQWIATKTLPTVVVLSLPDGEGRTFSDVCDGRGRVSVAVGMGWRVPAAFYSLKPGVDPFAPTAQRRRPIPRGEPAIDIEAARDPLEMQELLDRLRDLDPGDSGIRWDVLQNAVLAGDEEAASFMEAKIRELGARPRRVPRPRRKYRVPGLRDETIPRGARLYHGTASEEDFDLPHGPAWFSDAREVGKWFSTWHGESERSRILEFEVVSPIRLVRIDYGGDMETLGEFVGSDDHYEIAQALRERGYAGWTIPNNYPEGADILVCEPELWLRKVGEEPTNPPAGNPDITASISVTASVTFAPEVENHTDPLTLDEFGRDLLFRTTRAIPTMGSAIQWQWSGFDYSSSEFDAPTGTFNVYPAKGREAFFPQVVTALERELAKSRAEGWVFETRMDTSGSTGGPVWRIVVTHNPTTDRERTPTMNLANANAQALLTLLEVDPEALSVGLPELSRAIVRARSLSGRIQEHERPPAEGGGETSARWFDQGLDSDRLTHYLDRLEQMVAWARAHGALSIGWDSAPGGPIFDLDAQSNTIELFHGTRLENLDGILAGGLSNPFLTDDRDAALRWAKSYSNTGNDAVLLSVEVDPDRLVPDTNDAQDLWPEIFGDRDWEDVRGLLFREGEEMLRLTHENGVDWEESVGSDTGSLSVIYIGVVPPSDIRVVHRDDQPDAEDGDEGEGDDDLDITADLQDTGIDFLAPRRAALTAPAAIVEPAAEWLRLSSAHLRAVVGLDQALQEEGDVLYELDPAERQAEGLDDLNEEERQDVEARLAKVRERIEAWRAAVAQNPLPPNTELVDQTYERLKATGYGARGEALGAKTTIPLDLTGWPYGTTEQAIAAGVPAVIGVENYPMTTPGWKDGANWHPDEWKAVFYRDVEWIPGGDRYVPPPFPRLVTPGEPAIHRAVTHEFLHMAQYIQKAIQGRPTAGGPPKRVGPEPRGRNGDRPAHSLRDIEFHPNIDSAVDEGVERLKYVRHDPARYRQEFHKYLMKAFPPELRTEAPERWREAVRRLARDLEERMRREFPPAKTAGKRFPCELKAALRDTVRFIVDRGRVQAFPGRGTSDRVGVVATDPWPTPPFENGDFVRLGFIRTSADEPSGVDLRRRGIGAMLMGIALEAAREAGYDGIAPDYEGGMSEEAKGFWRALEPRGTSVELVPGFKAAEMPQWHTLTSEGFTRALVALPPPDGFGTWKEFVLARPDGIWNGQRGTALNPTAATTDDASSLEAVEAAGVRVHLIPAGSTLYHGTSRDFEGLSRPIYVTNQVDLAWWHAKKERGAPRVIALQATRDVRLVILETDSDRESLHAASDWNPRYYTDEAAAEIGLDGWCIRSDVSQGGALDARVLRPAECLVESEVWRSEDRTVTASIVGRHGWLDPEGTFYDCAPGQTHQRYADQLALEVLHRDVRRGDGFNLLLERGWTRVGFDGPAHLFTVSSLGTRQRAAIESFLLRVSAPDTDVVWIEKWGSEDDWRGTVSEFFGIVGETLQAGVRCAAAVPQTGVPFTFHFLRSTEKAPNLGARYGQDIEPAGRYLTVSSEIETTSHLDSLRRGPKPELADRYEHGEITFQNPLVIPWGSGGYADDDSWKRVLSNRYGGRKGRALSKAIVADGYDGIVTMRGDDPSECVDLRMFQRSAESARTTAEGRNMDAHRVAGQNRALGTPTARLAQGVREARANIDAWMSADDPAGTGRNIVNDSMLAEAVDAAVQNIEGDGSFVTVIRENPWVRFYDPGPSDSVESNLDRARACVFGAIRDLLLEEMGRVDDGPLPPAMAQRQQARRIYHGTPDEATARQIAATGKLIRDNQWRGEEGATSSMSGRVYATTDLEQAIGYLCHYRPWAIFPENVPPGRGGLVLLGQAQDEWPDEDWLGSLVLEGVYQQMGESLGDTQIGLDPQHVADYFESVWNELPTDLQKEIQGIGDFEDPTNWAVFGKRVIDTLAASNPALLAQIGSVAPLVSLPEGQAVQGVWVIDRSLIEEVAENPEAIFALGESIPVSKPTAAVMAGQISPAAASRPRDWWTDPTLGVGGVARYKVTAELGDAEFHPQERIVAAHPVMLELAGLDEEWWIVQTESSMVGRTLGQRETNGRILIAGSADDPGPYMGGAYWIGEGGERLLQAVYLDESLRRTNAGAVLADELRRLGVEAAVGPFSDAGQSYVRRHRFQERSAAMRPPEGFISPEGEWHQVARDGGHARFARGELRRRYKGWDWRLEDGFDQTTQSTAPVYALLYQGWIRIQNDPGESYVSIDFWEWRPEMKGYIEDYFIQNRIANDTRVFIEGRKAKQWARQTVAEFYESGPAWYASERNILDVSGQRHGWVVPAWLYHVTTLSRIPSIARDGLGGGAPNPNGFYGGYAAGDTFLSPASGVSYWFDCIEWNIQHILELETRQKNAPVLLRVFTQHLDPSLVEPDDLGAQDSKSSSIRYKGVVPVDAIAMWTGSEWVDLAGEAELADVSALTTTETASDGKDEWTDVRFHLPGGWDKDAAAIRGQAERDADETFEQHIERLRRERREAHAAFVSIFAPNIEFRSAKDEAAGRSLGWSFVSRETTPGAGEWRVQTFGPSGFHGHRSGFGTVEQARDALFDEVWRGGQDRVEPDPGALSRSTGTDEWTRGMERARAVQQWIEKGIPLKYASRRRRWLTPPNPTQMAVWHLDVGSAA